MNHKAIVQNLSTFKDVDVKFKRIVQFLYSSMAQFGR